MDARSTAARLIRSSILLAALFAPGCGTSGDTLTSSATGATGGAGSGQAGAGAGGLADGGSAGAAGQGGATGLGGQAGADVAGGAGGDGAGGGAGGPAGPSIRIHLRSSTDPFAHDDGLSGETPIDHRSGVRNFRLYTDANDPSPLVVFDYGQNAVEASYNAGQDTVIGTVPFSSLTPGHYTQARVVHSYVRYKMAATLHYNGAALAGDFNNTQVLSDNTMLDGQLRDHGYYDFVFEYLSMMFPKTGSDAPVPEYPSSGGFKVVFENGEWAYYFPVVIDIAQAPTADVDVAMEVNMAESLRWMDQDMPGYAPGVLDCTTTSSEPIKHFGANSFKVFLP